MEITNIIKGHYYSLTKQHKELHDRREEICNGCPLLNGNSCNKAIYIATINEEFMSYDTKRRYDFKDIDEPCIYSSANKNQIGNQEYTSGCGCDLDAKRRVKNTTCPINRWKEVDKEMLYCKVNPNELEECKQLGVVRFANKYKREIYGNT